MRAWTKRSDRGNDERKYAEIIGAYQQGLRVARRGAQGEWTVQRILDWPSEAQQQAWSAIVAALYTYVGVP